MNTIHYRNYPAIRSNGYRNYSDMNTINYRNYPGIRSNGYRNYPPGCTW